MPTPEERMQGKRSFIRLAHENPEIQELMRRTVNCHAKSCYLCTLSKVLDCFAKWRHEVIRMAWEIHGEKLARMRRKMIDDGTLEELKTKGHPTAGISREVPSVEEFANTQHEKTIKKIEKIDKAHRKGDIELLKDVVGGLENKE